MHRPRTYLDFNATAPLRAGAAEAWVRACEAYGNPSSVHQEGREARKLMELGRGQLAELMGVASDQLTITGSATEACNMVVGSGWDVILAADIEHDAVLGPARNCGAEVASLDIDEHGLIDVDALATKLSRMGPHQRLLVCVQAANNETGVLQPVSRICARVRETGAQVLCDAVQVIGKTEFEASTCGADFVVASAHKFGGPKGIGCLWVRPGSQVRGVIFGGGQEKGLRGGTEAVALVAAAGAAAKEAARFARDADERARVGGMRERIESHVAAHYPEAVIAGRNAERLFNTVNVILPGRRAETLVIAFDLKGIALSSGSACSSGKVQRSRVLEAMGFGTDLSGSALRISLGQPTSDEDISRFISAWDDVVGSKREGQRFSA